MHFELIAPPRLLAAVEAERERLAGEGGPEEQAQASAEALLASLGVPTRRSRLWRVYQAALSAGALAAPRALAELDAELGRLAAGESVGPGREVELPTDPAEALELAREGASAGSGEAGAWLEVELDEGTDRLNGLEVRVWRPGAAAMALAQVEWELGAGGEARPRAWVEVVMVH